MSTHTAFIARQFGQWKEEQLDTPTPGPGEVLVHVNYAPLIPLNVEIVEQGKFDLSQWLPHIPGINLAGVVAAVGEGVAEDRLAIGDKVFGMHLPSYGYKAAGMQRYAVIPHQALGKVPSNVTLEDAATVPDNLITSWWTLSHYFGLPLQPQKAIQPFSQDSFLIYGASSTTGQYLTQLLALAGCTRVFAVASSQHADSLRSFGATHIINYRDADWTDQVIRANGGEKVKYAVDIIATDTTLRNVGAVVGSDSKIAILLPMKFGHNRLIAAAGEGGELVWSLDKEQERSIFPHGGEVSFVRTFLYDTDEYLKENLMVKIIPELLGQGWVQPTKKELITEPGNSLAQRAEKGLDFIRRNVVSGQKIIVKI